MGKYGTANTVVTAMEQEDKFIDQLTMQLMALLCILSTSVEEVCMFLPHTFLVPLCSLDYSSIPHLTDEQYRQQKPHSSRHHLLLYMDCMKTDNSWLEYYNYSQTR